MTVHVETASRAELIAHIDALEAKLDAYGEGDRERRAMLIAATCRVTPTIAKIVDLLSDGRPYTKEAILNHLYFDRPDDPPEIKIIDVYICKARAALAAYGVTVETIWGAGYRMTAGMEAIAEITGCESGCPAVAATVMPPARPGRSSLYGTIRPAVLAILRQRQAEVGQNRTFTVMTRELAAALNCRTPVSTIFRQFEAAELLIIVRSTSRVGVPSAWTLRLTDKGMRP